MSIFHRKKKHLIQKLTELGRTKQAEKVRQYEPHEIHYDEGMIDGIIIADLMKDFDESNGGSPLGSGETNDSQYGDGGAFGGGGAGGDYEAPDSNDNAPDESSDSNDDSSDDSSDSDSGSDSD